MSFKRKDVIAFGTTDGSAEGLWGNTASSKIRQVKGGQQVSRGSRMDTNDTLSKGLGG